MSLIKPRLIEKSSTSSLFFQNIQSHINLRCIAIEDTGVDIGLPNFAEGCDDPVIYAALGTE